MLLFYIIIILMIYLCVFRSLMRPCGMPSSLRLVAYLLWCSLLLSFSIGRMRELNGYPSLLQSGPFRYDRGQIEEAAALLGVAMRDYLSPYWRSALLPAPPPPSLSLSLCLSTIATTTTTLMHKADHKSCMYSLLWAISQPIIYITRSLAKSLADSKPQGSLMPHTLSWEHRSKV